MTSGDPELGSGVHEDGVWSLAGEQRAVVGISSVAAWRLPILSRSFLVARRINTMWASCRYGTLMMTGRTASDAAVGHRIGTQYNTTIHTASGPTAIGTRATAVIEQGVSADLLALIEEARKAAQQLEGERQEELLDAIECLRVEASKAAGADTGEMVKRAGRVRQLAEKIGVPSLVAAVGGAVEAAVGIAMAGGFG